MIRILYLIEIYNCIYSLIGYLPSKKRMKNPGHQFLFTWRLMFVCVYPRLWVIWEHISFMNPFMFGKCYGLEKLLGYEPSCTCTNYFLPICIKMNIISHFHIRQSMMKVEMKTNLLYQLLKLFLSNQCCDPILNAPIQ